MDALVLIFIALLARLLKNNGFEIYFLELSSFISSKSHRRVVGFIPLLSFSSLNLSSPQPYCDGSHKGTKFTPIKFVAPETKTFSFCLCKYSNKMPLCDGEHKKFPGYVKLVKSPPLEAGNETGSAATLTEASPATGINDKSS